MGPGEIGFHKLVPQAQRPAAKGFTDGAPDARVTNSRSEPRPAGRARRRPAHALVHGPDDWYTRESIVNTTVSSQAEAGGGPAAVRYRRTVLEPGGSVSANDLVKNFLGRPQSMEALKRWMAVEFTPDPR